MFTEEIKQLTKKLKIKKDEKKLYLFKIPEDSYLCPEEMFYLRRDKGLCSVTIDRNDIHNFRDKLGSGVCFSEFLEDIIVY